MKQRFPKWVLYLLLVFTVLLLAGCQRVDEARTEFCGALADVGTLATEFKSAKVDQPVDEFKTKVDTLQDKKQTLERLARISPGDLLDRVTGAIDEVVEVVGSVTGNTLGPAAEKIQAAGSTLETAYLAVDEAVCAEK